MEIDAELERIAVVAAGLAGPGEELAAVIPTEPQPDTRLYLCAYSGAVRSWAALEGEGNLVTDRALVRAAVSIAGLCELAEESAGGGKLDELRRQLVELRETEHPEGIEEAEAAVVDLERTIRAAPRLASPSYLDAVGGAVRRLELALGEGATSPFAEAMKHGATVVAELELEVEAGYKGQLS